MYPIGTHYEKRVVMLEELYKLHVGEWVDLNNLVMDYFEKFFENIIEKRLVRNLQPDLKFPRLTTQILESKGYLVPGEEEKVEVKNVYRVEDWRKTISRSRVILQNSTTSVQHIPPIEELHPTLQSQPLVGSHLNEEGRQSVERVVDQPALAAGHLYVHEEGRQSVERLVG